MICFEFRGKIVTLLYEHCDQDLQALEAMKKIPNLRHTKIKPQNAFGHHHRSVKTIMYFNVINN